MTDLQLIKISVQRLKAMGLGSQKEIGKKLGYTNESAFSQVLNGKVNIPSDLFDRLSALDNDIKKFINENRTTDDKPSPRIEAKPLRLADPYGHEATGDKIYELNDGSLVMEVPIVSQRASAGYLRGFADPEFYDDLPTIPVMIDKKAFSTYMGFEVVGDSMVCLDTYELAEKSIFPGRIAVGRLLDRSKWLYKLHIHNYEAWIIVHKTEGILIKAITNHDVEAGKIVIHSLNPKYKDEIFDLDDIEQIFSVVKVEQKTR